MQKHQSNLYTLLANDYEIAIDMVTLFPQNDFSGMKQFYVIWEQGVNAKNNIDDKTQSKMLPSTTAIKYTFGFTNHFSHCHIWSMSSHQLDRYYSCQLHLIEHLLLEKLVV